MHEPVAGESGQQVKVAKPASPWPDDHIAVEVVLVIEARQSADAPGPLELREPAGQRRPDDTFEVTAVDGKVVAPRLSERRHTAGVSPAFRPECQAPGVLEIRQRLDRILALEEVLVPAQRLDR